MPRNPRVAPPGFAYHVLNRAVGHARLFRSKKDYAAFERVLGEARERFATPLLAWCVMPNHWHLVLWPQKVGELSEFMRWLTVTHTQRWHASHRTSGTGPLYQGRFKSFPIEQDDHLLTVVRYVERNALRASLVTRAKTGLGRACRNGRAARLPIQDRSLCRTGGRRSSTGLKRKRNWNACGDRSSEALRLAMSNGSDARRGDSGCNRP